ncbi:hypothetical protein GCM10010245_87120 [Streptomyces spectabilis]|nr:hypothetical protein GCM10010245_87120 [Streptomyces spectabilis]
MGLQTAGLPLRVYRDDLGLDPALDFHSLRRSYVTHLIENAMGPSPSSNRPAMTTPPPIPSTPACPPTSTPAPCVGRWTTPASSPRPSPSAASTSHSPRSTRLVTGTPERLSLPVLAALCDIFDCTPADLTSTRAENAAVRRVATGDAVVRLSAVRRKRARTWPKG